MSFLLFISSFCKFWIACEIHLKTASLYRFIIRIYFNSHEKWFYVEVRNEIYFMLGFCQLKWIRQRSTSKSKLQNNPQQKWNSWHSVYYKTFLLAVTLMMIEYTYVPYVIASGTYGSLAMIQWLFIRLHPSMQYLIINFKTKNFKSAFKILWNTWSIMVGTSSLCQLLKRSIERLRRKRLLWCSFGWRYSSGIQNICRSFLNSNVKGKIPRNVCRTN